MNRKPWKPRGWAGRNRDLRLSKARRSMRRLVAEFAYYLWNRQQNLSFWTMLSKFDVAMENPSFDACVDDVRCRIDRIDLFYIRHDKLIAPHKAFVRAALLANTNQAIEGNLRQEPRPFLTALLARNQPRIES